MEKFQAVKKLNSILRARLNFRKHLADFETYAIEFGESCLVDSDG